MNGLTYYDDGYILSYAKDDAGMVHLNGAFYWTTPPESFVGAQITQLPRGFIPARPHPVSCTARCGQNGVSWASHALIRTDGNLSFAGGSIPSGYLHMAGFIIDTVFLAAP